MKLAFLDRQEELGRLRSLFTRNDGGLAVLYGRRRLGKSRLVQEALPARSVLYVGDERDAELQRRGLARQIATLFPGFDEVVYPEWDALLTRWWDVARKGDVLVLDEFSSLVSVSPELPSLLQKYVDRRADAGAHLVLAGSSQRMMQGLVLGHAAPLFGRASEILKISPLPAFWITKALGHGPTRSVASVEAYAVWGGVPRYWELAADFEDRAAALTHLVLSPLGALHEEPRRLLLDDLRETIQATSILSLIGHGCHRVSEIAARLGRPASSLSRPLQRLVELELVKREVPFGVPGRTTKRSIYRIADPFLRYWFRFVDPNRSRLQAQPARAVLRDVERHFGHHAGEIWEELVRASVLRVPYHGVEWSRVGRWWGPGLDRKPQEIDVVAEASSADALLVGEVKWEAGTDSSRVLAALEVKAAKLPIARGRRVLTALWTRSIRGGRKPPNVFLPRDVIRSLR